MRNKILRDVHFISSPNWCTHDTSTLILCKIIRNKSPLKRVCKKTNLIFSIPLLMFDSIFITLFSRSPNYLKHTDCKLTKMHVRLRTHYNRFLHRIYMLQRQICVFVSPKVPKRTCLREEQIRVEMSVRRLDVLRYRGTGAEFVAFSPRISRGIPARGFKGAAAQTGR